MTSSSDRGSVGRSLTRSADRVDVSVAEFRVSDAGETLTTRGLGSCVAVTLYDETAGVGGLSHFMLPRLEESTATDEAKFVDSGVALMLSAMERHGAAPARTVARVVGGADMLDLGDTPVGARNVEVTRETLADHGVPIVGEDTEADHSRSVELDTATGDVRVVLPDGTVRSV